MKSIKYRILTLLCLSAWFGIHSQTDEYKSDAQRDWEHLDYMKNFFCKAPEGCKEYDNLNMLEGMRYVDRLYTNRSKLAEAFLEKYPNDPHYDDALTLFLSSYFTPLFIPDTLASDREEAIAKLPTRDQADVWAKAYRLLPVDRTLEKLWMEKGNALVANILDSNTSMERKAKAERLLFNRDYSIARERCNYLNKTADEEDFWESFQHDYFEGLMLRLEMLLDAYPDNEPMAKYIKAVLDDIRSLSTELANTYMTRFLKKTGDASPMANRKAFQALHKTLYDTREALETLNKGFSEPFEMTFTAMDGNQVDLKDMRGKVVLINFWTTTCPSCIVAMPKLKVLYDAYRDKGFEIIGIANEGDASKDEVLKIVNKANARWPQRLDKGSKASVNFHALYGIDVSPTFWILDTSGRVVERHVKMPQLASEISKYLGLTDK